MSWVSLHACFESIAKLKACKSLKPIPPSCLLVHSFFQLTQWIFLSSLFCPHQYFASKELMESHMDLGSLKRFMAYMGIACATVFIRTSRPAFDINFSFHPNIWLRIFSSNSLKVFTFDLPQVIGRPRYLSLLVITLAPICCWINFRISGFVFLLKNEVFWRLIVVPMQPHIGQEHLIVVNTLQPWLYKIVNYHL